MTKTKIGVGESTIEAWGYERTYFVVHAQVNRLHPYAILNRQELSRALRDGDLNDGCMVQDNLGDIYTCRYRKTYLVLQP